MRKVQIRVNMKKHHLIMPWSIDTSHVRRLTVVWQRWKLLRVQPRIILLHKHCSFSYTEWRSSDTVVLTTFQCIARSHIFILVKMTKTTIISLLLVTTSEMRGPWQAHIIWSCKAQISSSWITHMAQMLTAYIAFPVWSELFFSFSSSSTPNLRWNSKITVHFEIDHDCYLQNQVAY